MFVHWLPHQLVRWHQGADKSFTDAFAFSLKFKVSRSSLAWKLSEVSLLGELGVCSPITVNSVLHFSSECLDESLNRPGSSITKSADSVTLNLVGEFFEHVDLGEISISCLDSFKDVKLHISKKSVLCLDWIKLVKITRWRSSRSHHASYLILHPNSSI